MNKISLVRVNSIMALLVVSVLFSVSSALADNSLIPQWMITYRASLLDGRQALLNRRSELNSRLSALETAKRQCDIFLAGDISKDEHDSLISARAAVTQRINDLRAWLDDVERGLIEVDSSLRSVETSMTRIACIK